MEGRQKRKIKKGSGKIKKRKGNKKETNR